MAIVGDSTDGLGEWGRLKRCGSKNGSARKSQIFFHAFGLFFVLPFFFWGGALALV